jgi:hypothetical protein
MLLADSPRIGLRKREITLPIINLAEKDRNLHVSKGANKHYHLS